MRADPQRLDLWRSMGMSEADILAARRLLDTEEAVSAGPRAHLAEMQAARLDDIRILLGIAIVLLALILWRVW